ncbi:MAG TPA: DUF3999 family protein, partial [Alphaproteobacteria bacterium]|nr:DUF3999 family protein [Alphaproteobacteria bacterium]
HAAKWALLGSNIVYDFSSERLGANRTLRLPLSRYKYLRITIDGPVKPKDVQGATAVERQEDKAVWRDVSSEAKREQKGQDTVFTFSVPENVPVERVMFAVDSAQPNFRRTVELRGEKDITVGSGEISRVHMVRRGQKIDYEDYDVDFFSSSQKTIQVTIHNGDDPPLRISSVHLQQLERRLYFDAPSAGALALYYGDEKLERPIYDYAKLFQKEKSPIEAQTGPEVSNTAFTGRPDDRPWSERHPAVLWTAIVLAVLVLGGLAVRSMKTAAA